MHYTNKNEIPPDNQITVLDQFRRQRFYNDRLVKLSSKDIKFKPQRFNVFNNRFNSKTPQLLFSTIYSNLFHCVQIYKSWRSKHEFVMSKIANIFYIIKRIFMIFMCFSFEFILCYLLMETCYLLLSETLF